MYINPPLVSILVPVYGTEKYIGTCAESIFSQDYPNLEAIFVNDKTPDRSIEVLEETISRYSKIKNVKIRIVNLPNNVGLPGVRNRSLKLASGDYVFFLDSDDAIPSNAISKLMEVAISSGADIVKGSFQPLTVNGLLPPHLNTFPNDRVAYARAMVDWCTISPSVCGGIYKYSLFTNNNITFIEGYNMGEDYGVSSKLAYFVNEVQTISDVVYYYRTNPNSITHSFTTKHAKDLMVISDSVFNFYKSKSDYTQFADVLKNGRVRIKLYILKRLRRKDKIIADDFNIEDITFKDKFAIAIARHSSILYKVLRKCRIIKSIK